jgi:hypothetical protein
MIFQTLPRFSMHQFDHIHTSYSGCSYRPTADMIKWGWMRKKGSERRNWSERWVILSKSGEIKYCGCPHSRNVSTRLFISAVKTQNEF